MGQKISQDTTNYCKSVMEYLKGSEKGDVKIMFYDQLLRAKKSKTK